MLLLCIDKSRGSVAVSACVSLFIDFCVNCTRFDRALAVKRSVVLPVSHKPS